MDLGVQLALDGGGVLEDEGRPLVRQIHHQQPRPPCGLDGLALRGVRAASPPAWQLDFPMPFDRFEPREHAPAHDRANCAET